MNSEFLTDDAADVSDMQPTIINGSDGIKVLQVIDGDGELSFYPLDVEYGAPEFVTYSYDAQSKDLCTVWQDAFENILSETHEKLHDSFPVVTLLSTGDKELKFVRRQKPGWFGSMEQLDPVEHVTVTLDSIQRVS